MVNIKNFSYNKQLRWNGKQFSSSLTKTRASVGFNVARISLQTSPFLLQFIYKIKNFYDEESQFLSDVFAFDVM